QHKVDICARRPLSQCLLCRGHGLSLRVLRTPGSQDSWDCTIVRPTEDLLLFPQMFSVVRVIAMVLAGTSSAQSQTQESPPSFPSNWPAHYILLSRGMNGPSKWNMRDSWGR